MKKILSLIFILSILVQPIIVFAQDTDNIAPEEVYMEEASQKLKRGMTNVVACYGEISQSFGTTYEEDGFMAALSYGLVEGSVLTVRRAIVGVFETLTFFVPSDPIINDPEFFKE
jgi:putative exosortase-associated protein (TIGR04073 family)